MTRISDPNALAPDKAEGVISAVALAMPNASPAAATDLCKLRWSFAAHPPARSAGSPLCHPKPRTADIVS